MKRTWSPADLIRTGAQVAGPLTNVGTRVGSLRGRLLGTGDFARRPYSVTAVEYSGFAAASEAKTAIATEEDDPRIKRMRVEAILLLAKTPLTPRKLAQMADLADGTETRTLVRQLNHAYEIHGRALRVEQVAGGYRLLTRPALAPWLAKLGHLPPAVRLSTPMMETLAVVAYRQPVSRASAEAVRGVGCGELLRQLMERDLIRIAGRGEELGRPYLYGTTKRFLQLFGLPSADALPPIQWQTLQDDPDQADNEPDSHSLDSPPDELSTSPKESFVSTVVAPVLSEADPQILSLSGTLVPPTEAVSLDQNGPAAVIEDDDDEVWDDDDDDDLDDDEMDDDWDDEDDDEDDDDDDDDDDEDDDDVDLEDDEDEKDDAVVEWQEVDDDDSDEEWDDDDDDDDDWDDDDEADDDEDWA